jgi:BirA family biotin operon repressor/biotin-[acetyl-CoA-carboxylase] ligase
VDELGPEVVEPLLRGRFGRPYRYEPIVASTQELLGPDDDEGAVVSANEQRSGRGRFGRAWVAPPGTSLMFSLLLHPPRERRWAELSLVAGVATAEIVEVALGQETSIKWPNDVLVSGAKVSGILAELRERAVVIGIGLNVNQAPDQLPRETTTPSTSLRAIDAVVRERAPLLAELLFRLQLRYDEWLRDGLRAVRHELERRDFLRGRQVCASGIDGVAVGIDAEGRLQLEVAGARQSFEGGEISYR